MKRWLILALLLAFVAPALAQSNFPTPNTPSTPSVPGIVGMCLNAAGQAVPASSGQCAPSGAYGADSGPVTAALTPANSSHAAGTALGAGGASGNQSGLFVLSIARSSGGSGIAIHLWYKSTGGSTGVILARAWSRLPANTTCKDNTAFAGSDTDDAYLLGAPFSFTPVAPANTTGDSATYADLQNLNIDFKNQDAAPTQNIYVCLVTVATDTADENNLIRLYAAGPQN